MGRLLAGVVFAVDGFHAVGVDVGVDLGGDDVGVAEEFLDDAEVGAAGEEVGGEGVAEGVGVDGADAGTFGHAADELPEDDAGDGAAGAGDEEAIGVGFGAGGFDGQEEGAEFFYVFFEGGDGGGADGDDAFLVAFAQDADDAQVEVEVVEGEFGEFRGAQAAGVEEFDDGLVAECEAVAGFGGVEEGGHLVAAEDVGEFFPLVGGIEEFGGVLLGEFAHDGEAVEHFEAGDVAEDGGDGELAIFL